MKISVIIWNLSWILLTNFTNILFASIFVSITEFSLGVTSSETKISPSHRFNSHFLLEYFKSKHEWFKRMSASFVNNCTIREENQWNLYCIFFPCYLLLKQVICCSRINFIITFIIIQGRNIGKFSRYLKIKFSDFVTSGEVNREKMHPKKGWTGISISNPKEGRVQGFFWGLRPLTLY